MFKTMASIGLIQSILLFPHVSSLPFFSSSQPVANHGIISGHPDQSYGYGTWKVKTNGYKKLTIQGQHYGYQYTGTPKNSSVTLKNVPFDVYTITYQKPGYQKQEVPFNDIRSVEYQSQQKSMKNTSYIVQRIRSNKHLELRKGNDGKYHACRKDGTWEFNEAGKYTVTIYQPQTKKKLYLKTVTDARPIDFSHVPYQNYSVKIQIRDTTETLNSEGQLVTTRPKDKTTIHTFSYENSWEKSQHLAKNVNYTGLLKNPSNKNWYYVEQGNYKKKSTIAQNDNGWYCTDKNGKVKLQYTGLAKKAKRQWYYCKKGKVDFSKYGLVRYKGKQYLVQKGQVNFHYNGTYRYQGKTYHLKNGQTM